MTDNNYIYIPSLDISNEFRCRVPMEGTQQIFLVNGSIQGTHKPFVLDIESGKSMKDLLQIIAIRTDGSDREISFDNNIHLGRESSGKLLLCSHTFSSESFITKENVNIHLEAHSDLDIVVMQNENNHSRHITNFAIKFEEGASLKMVFLTLHGGNIENNINISLDGKRASCLLNGLYLVDGRQILHNNINLVHNVPECSSKQLFKGILDDEAQAHFFGLINVVPGAQKTEAYQANHNLLLSNAAKVFSEPQLEIYADDVKCSHGATNGRLDEDGLFYLRSRGISLKEAALLQQQAFAIEVLDQISNPALRERMSKLTEQRLRGEFSDCKNCSKNCC